MHGIGSNCYGCDAGLLCNTITNSRLCAEWQDPWDSNPDRRFWRPSCCRYNQGPVVLGAELESATIGFQPIALPSELPERMVGGAGFEPAKAEAGGFTDRIL